MEQLKGSNHPNSRWTEEMIREVTRLGLKGLAFSEIARQVNAKFGTSFSRNAVIGVSTRRNLFEPQPKRRERNGGVVPVLKRANNKPTSLKRVRQMSNETRLRTRASVEPSPKGPMSDFPASDACLYIHGDPMVGEWQCCAHKRRDASPYCEFHHAVCTSVETQRSHRGRVLVPLAVRR